MPDGSSASTHTMLATGFRECAMTTANDNASVSAADAARLARYTRARSRHTIMGTIAVIIGALSLGAPLLFLFGSLASWADRSNASSSASPEVITLDVLIGITIILILAVFVYGIVLLARAYAIDKHLRGLGGDARGLRTLAWVVFAIGSLNFAVLIGSTMVGLV